jgi:hypothetical protein
MSAKMGEITQFSGGMISTVEKKRNLNILRNKHHFKNSDAELKSMKDTLKAQSQYKKETMDQGKSKREDNKSECTKVMRFFTFGIKFFLTCMYWLILRST